VDVVSGSDLKKHLTFQITLVTASGILCVNLGHYPETTDSIPVTINLTFRNNRIDMKYEKLIQQCFLLFKQIYIKDIKSYLIADE
jgi:hypothetical protein